MPISFIKRTNSIKSKIIKDVLNFFPAAFNNAANTIPSMNNTIVPGVNPLSRSHLYNNRKNRIIKMGIDTQSFLLTAAISFCCVNFYSLWRFGIFWYSFGLNSKVGCIDCQRNHDRRFSIAFYWLINNFTRTIYKQVGWHAVQKSTCPAS